MLPSELSDLAQRKHGAGRPEDVRDGDDSCPRGDAAGQCLDHPGRTVADIRVPDDDAKTASEERER
jgi:hypothetical protein